MGRPASSDWSHAHCHGKKAKCKHCSTEFKKDIERLQQHFCEEWNGRRHVHVCTKAPDKLKKEFQQRHVDAQRVALRKRKQAGHAAEDAEEARKKFKQASLEAGFASVEI